MTNVLVFTAGNYWNFALGDSMALKNLDCAEPRLYILSVVACVLDSTFAMLARSIPHVCRFLFSLLFRLTDC